VPVGAAWWAGVGAGAVVGRPPCSRYAIKHVIMDTNTDGPLCATSLVTKTNQPYYLCVACKKLLKIKKGDTIQVHYSPAPGILMAQNAQEEFVC